MQDNNNIKPSEFTTNTVIQPAEFKPPSATGFKSTRIQFASVLTIVILLLCSTTAWFIFTAKSVYIDIDPAEASVEIDGGLNLKLADRFLMREGAYKISIEYPRYYPQEQQIIINELQNQQFSYQLQPLPGHLDINTSIPDKAEVWIDDKLKGETPLVVRNLTHGSHTLELIADRYLPYAETVDIEGLDKQQSITIELTPAWGDITFLSQPSGAEVYVNDELVGQTPVTSEVLQGEHDIRVSLSGYKAWSDTLSVTANEAMELPVISLQEADAIIHLQSRPSRANITVNGEYKGQTPLEIAVTPGERLDIRFFKQGYQRTRRTLSIDTKEVQNLSVELEPELTPVVFFSTPPDAELYIDGIFRGRARQTIELTTQAHEIEIKKEGYADYRASITPRNGVAQQVRTSLKTLQQVKQESIKKVITTAAGQTMKLFYPSGYTMGASRREAGRRANETLRNVELARPFYLSLHEVTNEAFQAFDKNHSSGDVQGSSLGGAKQPVVNITWEQAALYCNWLSKKDTLTPFYIVNNNKITGFDRGSNGYRLPTEAEWAWSARVIGRQQVLKFPWGDKLPPVKGSGNYADESAAAILGRIITGYNDSYIATAPVGSFKANSKGIFDLGGNVAEWVHDYYDISIVSGNRTEADPMGPDNGEHHVIRGSSWAHGTITELRLSFRDYSDKGRDDVGFRIARYLE